MKITIYRTKQSKDKLTTTGILYIDGTAFCHTLEDMVRDNLKVHGETAIEEGVYVGYIRYSNKFKRKLIALKDVPNFKYILIHPGNTKKDSLGCILVGEEYSDTEIRNSRKTENKLMKMVSTAETIEVEIVNLF